MAKDIEILFHIPIPAPLAPNLSRGQQILIIKHIRVFDYFSHQTFGSLGFGLLGGPLFESTFSLSYSMSITFLFNRTNFTIQSSSQHCIRKYPHFLFGHCSQFDDYKKSDRKLYGATQMLTLYNRK